MTTPILLISNLNLIFVGRLGLGYVNRSQIHRYHHHYERYLLLDMFHYVLQL